MIAPLKEASRPIPDTLRSMRSAPTASTTLGRAPPYGKCELHNRRRTWLRLFRYYASLHGIEKDIQIFAPDRSSNYACELLGKRDRGQARRDIVLRTRQFGICENALEGPTMRAEKRNASFKARSGAWSFLSN